MEISKDIQRFSKITRTHAQVCKSSETFAQYLNKLL